MSTRRVRRPEQFIRRPPAVVSVRDDRHRRLRRVFRRLHTGQVQGVPVRVAGALFVQAVWKMRLALV